MNRLQANLCLLCVTLMWSMETVLYSCIPEGIPTFATSCVTSFAGTLLLFGAFYKRVITGVRQNGRRLIVSCFICAILNALYNTMFLYGTKSFDVASGAFTFCMTVVVLPVVLLTAKRQVCKETWVSVLLVFAGIVMALGPTLQGKQLTGLAIMGGGCLLRAIFIVLTADLAKKYDPLCLAIVLQFFAGVFSLGGWFLEEPRLFLALPLSRTLIASWAIYSYFIVALALAFNFFAMRHVTATNATVVYSLEIVFAIFWGMILPPSVIEKVPLTPTILIGTLLVLIGSLTEILDLSGKRTLGELFRKKEVER